MSKKPLKAAINRALYGAAVVTAATGIPAVASAQEDVLEEIVVTGSRIATDPNLVTSSPVTSVSAAEVELTGITRIEDLVNDLPQVVPEFTANDSNGATGTATLDLRGLGSERTLVLVNGHRMGPGDPVAPSPDINQIPARLVERVEILTGGASSTYGSDAVSGVVNFIMKDDFEGFEITWQQSGYQHDNSNGAAQAAIDAAGFEQAPGDVTDGGITDITAIMGVDLNDGRGNVTAYFGYRDIDAIRHSERDYSACALSGADNGVGNCVGSSTTPNGRFTDFAVDGVDLQLNLETGAMEPYADAYNYGPLNYFQRPDERYTAGMFGRYEIAPRLEAYAEFMFMDDRSLAQIAPSGTFFNNTGIPCSNPFLTAEQYNAFGCTSPDDFVTIYVGRRNVEGGPRFSDLRHQSFRTLLGFRGDITDAWSFDIFFNFARLNYTENYNNDLSISAINNALNVVPDPDTGQPVCAATLAGLDANCVPYNVFVPGQITQAALDYLTLPLYSIADIDTDNSVGYLYGDLGEYGVKLPWASDGIQVVFGYEYGDQNFIYDLDQNYNQGNAAGQGGATADVSGAILRKEIFTEFGIPLIQDARFAQDLSLDLRYRYSDYDIGVEADTWSVGLAWALNDAFKFRTSLNRAVRAPSVNELYSPQTIGLWQGTDPCAGPNPTLTEAQCALTGVPAGAYGGVPPNPADQYNNLAGGNPNLDPETSDSFTVGVVMTPDQWVPGLTLSIDYWSIEVEDAIDTVDEEFAINQCGLTGNATFCSLIQRNPVNGNLWVGSGPGAPRVTATDVNIGFFEVEGWDINGTYTSEWGRHGLDFAYRGSVLTKWDELPQPGAPINDCKGKWGGACGRPRPEYKHTFTTTWHTPWDGARVSATWRYIGEVDEEGQDRFTADSQSYFDLAGAYDFDLFGGNTRITAGINNILDEDPPVSGLFNTADYSNGNTIPGTWDPLGRYWFVGFTYTRGSE